MAFAEAAVRCYFRNRSAKVLLCQDCGWKEDGDGVHGDGWYTCAGGGLHVDSSVETGQIANMTIFKNDAIMPFFGFPLEMPA